MIRMTHFLQNMIDELAEQAIKFKSLGNFFLIFQKAGRSLGAHTAFCPVKAWFELLLAKSAE